MNSGRSFAPTAALCVKGRDDAALGTAAVTSACSLRLEGGTKLLSCSGCQKLRLCGRFPPEVKTAIPVEDRFEHVVLSCNTTSDHSLVWIEREAQKALDLMKEQAEIPTPPAQQMMERKQTLEKEHRDALERAVSLSVPHAISPAEESTAVVVISAAAESQEEELPSAGRSKSSGRTNWDDLVEKLFTRSKSGNLLMKKDIIVTEEQ